MIWFYSGGSVPYNCLYFFLRNHFLSGACRFAIQFILFLLQLVPFCILPWLSKSISAPSRSCFFQRVTMFDEPHRELPVPGPFYHREGLREHLRFKCLIVSFPHVGSFLLIRRCIMYSYHLIFTFFWPSFQGSL
jgi:hypothetical protein